jgi:hypothetical protein
MAIAAPAAPRIQASAVEVIASQPPPGSMVPAEHLPANARGATADLLPGANPVFGLNTLGGVLSSSSKSGDTRPDNTRNRSTLLTLSTSH